VAKYVSSPNTAAVLCKSIWVADLEMRALKSTGNTKPGEVTLANCKVNGCVCANSRLGKDINKHFRQLVK